MDSRNTYIARINRVIDHIDSHLPDPLDLATLASVAHFSAWHFHRVFQAMTGETLADHVRRRRLEVAAARLLLHPQQPVVAIALDVGFGSAAVFTRVFGVHFGCTPTAWRRGAFRTLAERHRQELSKIRQAERKTHQAVAHAFLHDERSWPMGRIHLEGESEMKVELKTLPEARIAYLRHHGAYAGAGIPRTWQRLATWSAQRGLMQPGRTMYGVNHDNPDVTPPEKCRYDAGIEVDAGFHPEGEIGVQNFRGGRYACAEFSGTSEQIHAAWMRLCEWLPDSGWQADDAPPVELYGSDFAIDAETGAFRCSLCMPVRPL